ncbi:hypothetical protein GCM10009754_18810 [Amycolatopsis minnesotensis]|uniref:YbaB/EbfC DNA-binding family protein n=2 Tax=Amycolatopsis minnesotensis TaxID=337894 RepID=A0ABN2QEY6_9PSEU
MAVGQEWLANYSGKIADIQRRAAEAQEQIKNMRARAESPDGAVKVVLAPGGRVENLELTPQAMSLGPDRLAAAIKQTIQKAHADAAGQTQAAVTPLVGDDSDAMEFLREQIGAAQQEEEPEEAPKPAAPGEQAPVLRPAYEQQQAPPPPPPPAPPVPPAPPARPRRARPADDDDDEPFGGSIMR